MNPLHERRRALGMARPCFVKQGAKSSSTNTTNNTVINTDARLAVSNGIGISGNNSSVTVNNTTTDANALLLAEKAMLATIDANAQAAGAAAASAQQQAAQDRANAAAESRQAAITKDASYAFATEVNATNADGFSKLLDTGLDLFKTNVGTFEKLLAGQLETTANTQALTAQAYQTATAEKSGSIDNKTIMVLGLAGAAALAFTMKKG